MASNVEVDTPTEEQREEWRRKQDYLKEKMIICDTERWALDAEYAGLKYVAGADISFFKHDNQSGYATLSVIDYHSKQLVHSTSKRVNLKTPYCPGFLGFREAEWYNELMEAFRYEGTNYQPQLIIVDGNGIMHPKGFGLACHLGVLLEIPTIGVSKNYLSINGEDPRDFKQRAKKTLKRKGEFLEVKNLQNEVIAAALRPTDQGDNPIYISPGHRVSLETAVKIVKHLCKYRIPEPTRQADIISGELVRKEEEDMNAVQS